LSRHGYGRQPCPVGVAWRLAEPGSLGGSAVWCRIAPGLEQDGKDWLERR
jgi:hypothetical protein